MNILETPSECTIKIDNKKIKHNVSGLELYQYIDDHHELRVSIRQAGEASGQDFENPETYTSFLGKSVSVNIKPTGGYVDAARELEFIGVVTEVRIDNSVDRLNDAIITAHSPTMSFDGAKHNAQYTDQSASDIIGSLLRKYPITLGNIESTSGTYKFDTQYRETDYEYILRVAKSQGLFAYYNGKEFKLEKAQCGDVDELVWRETLGSFRMGLGTVAHEFTAKVYNYEQKKTFSQDTKSLTAQASLSNLSKVSPDASKEVYKDSGYSEVSKAAADAQSLDSELQAERNRALGGMVKCYGQSNVPKVSIGHCVKIKGMDKLDGSYWVKAVKHVFEESGKYHNNFVCSPIDISYPEKRSMAEVLEEAEKPLTVAQHRALVQEPEIQKKARFSGLHSALVIDNKDPDGLGRIKVQYPWAESETIWIRFVVPYAGADRGWFSLPEVGDEVIVGYEFGDPDYPIALGAVYNNESQPPGDTEGNNCDIKMLQTRSGNQIYFNDADGSEELRISMKDGKNGIVMKLSGPTVSIKSDGGDISIESNNITIESQADIKLKAGANINIEAGANLTLKGTAQLNAEGGMTAVKGNPIQLN